MSAPTEPALSVLLRALKLPTFVEYHEEAAHRAEEQGWTFAQFLRHLCEAELSDRKRRRIDRNLRASKLPAEKTMATIDLSKFSVKVRRQVAKLSQGKFAVDGDDVLAFGLPGRGKTHLCCAIGHELVKAGFMVLFVPAFRLVQSLLNAKRELELDRELRRLDRFDVVLVDDIGYVQQDREEMEVLFTFLSERYERKSVMITSNLVFSQWDRIFKDPMTTAAAIDRLVHHSVILGLAGPSIRELEAKKRSQKSSKPSTPPKPRGQPPKNSQVQPGEDEEKQR